MIHNHILKTETKTQKKQNKTLITNKTYNKYNKSSILEYSMQSIIYQTPISILKIAKIKKKKQIIS